MVDIVFEKTFQDIATSCTTLNFLANTKHCGEVTGALCHTCMFFVNYESKRKWNIL